MLISILIHFNYITIIYLFYHKVNKLYKIFYNYSFWEFTTLFEKSLAKTFNKG